MRPASSYSRRIGQEVIIDFLGGDPDQPVCTGRVYNALNMPPWALPEQQALSGFRSRELNPASGNSAGGRSNHLILDDTQAQIQAQLKSDHQHSQLSLGHITRIENNQGRQDARGQGFELRTDGHGALRAQDGLLISTEGRTQARAHMLDMGETTARLSQAQQQHQNLGELAEQHQAQDAQDQAQVALTLKAQHEAVKGAGKETVKGEGQYPELQKPHLVLSSPAGIQSTTQGSTHQHSGGHHVITSGGHTSVSSGQSLLASARQAIRLFAYKAGIKLIAANSDIDVRALQRNINLLGKINIEESANSINLSAKESITFNGGGSYTTWSAAGISHHTAGRHDMHAATNTLDMGGASTPVVIPQLPTAALEGDYQTRFDVGAMLENDPLLAGAPYEFWLKSDNKTLLASGLLNDMARTAPVHTQESDDIFMVIGDHEWENVSHVQYVEDMVTDEGEDQ